MLQWNISCMDTCRNGIITHNLSRAAARPTPTERGINPTLRRAVESYETDNLATRGSQGHTCEGSTLEPTFEGHTCSFWGRFFVFRRTMPKTAHCKTGHAHDVGCPRLPGVCRGAARRIMHQPDFPLFVCERTYRVHQDEFLQWLAAQAKQPSPGDTPEATSVGVRGTAGLVRAGLD